jgi:mycothiol synthase
MGWRRRTSVTGQLAPAEVAAVQHLVAAATGQDGFTSLNEAGLLNLQHPHEGLLHVLELPDDDQPLGAGGELRGYGQLDGGTASSTGQLVVAPGQRRDGVGTALLGQLLDQAPSRLQVWALGDTAGARALAARAGLVPVRELLVMTRPLDQPLRLPQLPPGTGVRTFVPGRDEPAWLGVNGRAFASHPEQGAITADDLAQRMAEDWFDPAGFFLAERDGHLVGFHWTKQHPDGLGEVYVLGVDPDAGGRGLGGALLDTGLEHLRRRGNRTVELYVEGDHARAVALYESRGFTTANRDVMYAQP